MFAVIVFHDGRNDYLEQALSTFIEQVAFPTPPYKILIDDMPAGRDSGFIHDVGRHFGFDDVVLNDETQGSFGAIMTAWSRLPPDTDYVFHLENDFVFPERVDVAELASVLDEPSICNITLLRQAWYDDEREAGGVMRVRPDVFRESVVRGIPVILHQDYFGHNPGLYKRAFARIIPNTSRTQPGVVLSHERIYRDLLLAEDPTRQFAILGRLADPPRVLHIGHRRVGITPDQGAPQLVEQLSPADEQRAVAAEVQELQRQATVLTHQISRVLEPAIAARERALQPAERSDGPRTSPVGTGFVPPSGSDASDTAELRRAVGLLEAHNLQLQGRITALDHELARTESGTGNAHAPRFPTGGRQPVVRILMYHRVGRLPEDPAGLCLAPAAFRDQMEHLARRYEPMGLETLAASVASGQIPDRAVAITLDDGYADALAASDILSELRLPATFFLNSSAGGETVLDALTRVFGGAESLPSSIDLNILATSVRLPCDTPGARRAAFDAFREIAWPLSNDGRRELVTALRRWSGRELWPRPSHRMLTPAEVRELANRPNQSIGVHTANHLCLPIQSPAAKIHEIAANHRYLEDLVGEAISAVAYPYGVWDQDVVRICRGLGFQTGVIVSNRPVYPWTDRLLLPRLEVKTEDARQFEAFLENE